WRQCGLMQVENVEIEVEIAPRRNGQTVQMRSTKEERPRPVAQSAGALSQRLAGFEETCVDGWWRRIPQQPAERAAQHIGALPFREMHRASRPKVKPEAVKLKDPRAGRFVD